MKTQFRPDKWIVRCGEYEFQCIGYEQRGLFLYPIAVQDEESGEYICTTVYEIVMGYIKLDKNTYIGADRLNQTEVSLLEDVGCIWEDQCWITKK